MLLVGGGAAGSAGGGGEAQEEQEKRGKKRKETTTNPKEVRRQGYQVVMVRVNRQQKIHNKTELICSCFWLRASSSHSSAFSFL